MPAPTIVLFALLTLPLNGSGLHVFGVGGRPMLCVPESDLDPLVMPYADESVNLHPGSGHTPGFPFLFHAETVQKYVGGYVVVPGFEGHPYVNTLSGTVGFLGKIDRARLGSSMRARDTGDEWRSKGNCPQTRVTPLGNKNLYEVRCSVRANYSSIWNRMPDVKVTMPRPNDLVVATCDYASITMDPYKGKSLENCSRVSIVDGYLVDYRFQESNAKIIPEIDAMIRQKFSEWKANCAS